MRPLILVRYALCVLAVCWTTPGFGLQEPPANPQAASEARTKSLARAFELISEGKLKKAKAEIERATAMAGGPCGECLLGMSHVYASEKQWNKAVDASQRAIPLLKSPGALARAYNQLGIANVMLNTPDSLTRAEAALRQGADVGGAWGAMARYNLAELLYRRRDWAEAVEASRRYLQEAGPDGRALKEARMLLCRARDLLPDEPAPEPGGDLDLERADGEVQRPQIISQTEPQYTQAAREAYVKGKVIVEAIIDEDGCVRNVRVLQGLSHGLTESAIEAVRRWVFSPATFRGSPVKVYYVLTVNFNLQNPPPT